MDKRLELTAKQKELVFRFNELVKEMENEKIGIIYKEFNELYAYNEANVERAFYDDDVSEEDGDVCVEIDSITPLYCPNILTLTWLEDDSFGVHFKD